MEYGSIEREFRIDAAPEIVFEVVSSPAHIREWWGAETDLEPVDGAAGALIWTDKAASRTDVVPITVMDAQPPRLFSFRWAYGAGEQPTPTNSLLVTFELVPSGDGTLLRLTETGFREMGWEAAVLEEVYNDHGVGWDAHLGQLVAYATQLASTS